MAEAIASELETTSDIEYIYAVKEVSKFEITSMTESVHWKNLCS